jgi:hypothetical protein
VRVDRGVEVIWKQGNRAINTGKRRYFGNDDSMAKSTSRAEKLKKY